MHLMFGITTESRQLILAFPFVVGIGVKVLDNINWSTTSILLITILCLVVSKIWLPIDTEPQDAELLEFPMQSYFMNFGPWMGDEMYVYHAIGFIVLAGLLYLLLRRNNLIFERSA